MNGLRDDLSGVNSGNGVDVPVDEGWADQYSGGVDAGEDEAKVGGQTIPTFPHYIVHFESAKGGFTKGAKKTPLARVVAKVVEGLDGTDGERVFDDLFLRVSKTETIYEDGQAIDVPKDPQDYAEHVESFQKRLNKIARVGEFSKAFPSGTGLDAINLYAEQFGVKGGFDAVVEIREQTDKYQGTERRRNRIVWESLRAFDDPATKNGRRRGYKSAVEEARAEIAARLKASANAGGGRTAGSVARRSTGLAD